MSSPDLPPETFDYIIDLLYDQPQTLRDCCLVSKSWVPRTRKHLFADIKFHSVDTLGSWKNTFPDPSSSPAYHTLSLFIGCPQVIVKADGEDGSWIWGFSRIERLAVNSTWTNFHALEISLILGRNYYRRRAAYFNSFDSLTIHVPAGGRTIGSICQLKVVFLHDKR